MVRPKNIKDYDSLNLKLRIKSSLTNIKSVLSLLILMFISEEKPSRLLYSKQLDDKIVVEDEVFERLYFKNKDLLDANSISKQVFKNKINENNLFQTQYEPLFVACSLIWKVANIKFDDDQKSASVERTGGVRYPKVIEYTANLDVIYQLYNVNEEEISKVLLNWIGIDSIVSDTDAEQSLLLLLNIFSETATYRSRESEDTENIFNLNSIYETLLEQDEAVDIEDFREATGPLRILKSALNSSMHPLLDYTAREGVNIKTGFRDTLENYSQRVDKLLELNTAQSPDLENDEVDEVDEIYKVDEPDYTGPIHGINKLYYGAPGSGKSYNIGEFIRSNGIPNYNEKKDYENVLRVTLHPDYQYSDFVGQVMPVTEEDDSVEDGMTKITYAFNPGPLTLALEVALKYEDKKVNKPVFLILEELSRANVAAVFGDIFQLLDRNENGYSEYSIANDMITGYINEKANFSLNNVRIPGNMFILGTVNTSDQNVFVMDTAFKRRFEFEYVDANELAKDKEGNIINNYHFSLTNADNTETDFNWINLYQSLNRFIVSTDFGLGLPEDKQLGQFFIKFIDGKDDYNYNQILNKLLEYLWNDVENVSYSNRSIFKDENEGIDSFSKLYRMAKEKKNFFSQNFLEQLL